jgi:hypothetical protein
VDANEIQARDNAGAFPVEWKPDRIKRSSKVDPSAVIRPKAAGKNDRPKSSEAQRLW